MVTTDQIPARPESIHKSMFISTRKISFRHSDSSIIGVRAARRKSVKKRIGLLIARIDEISLETISVESKIISNRQLTADGC